MSLTLLPFGKLSFLLPNVTSSFLDNHHQRELASELGELASELASELNERPHKARVRRVTGGKYYAAQFATSRPQIAIPPLETFVKLFLNL